MSMVAPKSDSDRSVQLHTWFLKQPHLGPIFKNVPNKEKGKNNFTGVDCFALYLFIKV